MQNGGSSRASGTNSHSEGMNTTASGNSAHSEGWNTTAGGNYSHSEGYGTKASSENQHVQGKYNIEDTQGKYAHIIGNGTANNNRSNAQTVDWQANLWQKGNIRMGGNSYDDGIDVATVNDIPDQLSDLSDDSTHRLVTDTEKQTWNNKSDFSGNYNDLTNKPTIPDELSDLQDDSTHRLVTDSDKSKWNSYETEIEKLKDNSIKGTVTGTTITLTDQYPTKLLDYKVKGNSIQHRAELPVEYQEVEYIESTGTQAIDTGHDATNKKYKAVLDTQFTQATEYSQILLSAGINAWCGQIRNVYGIGGSYKTTISSLDRATLEFIGNYENNISCRLKINNEEVIRPYMQNEGNVSLFAGIEQQTTFSYHSKAKLYSAKLYDENNTLIRDFIPCYRKSDNVIGLYDIVNNRFYTNAGTGTFSKGNNVSPSTSNPQPIYSVGDLVESGEHQGEYAVPIKMSGKNLLSNIFTDYITNNGIYEYYKLIEAFNNSYLVASFTDNDTSIDMSGIFFGFTANGGNYDGGGLWIMANGSITELNRYTNVYKYFSIYPKNEETLNKIFQRFNLQIEIRNNTTPTTYEPYITPITTNIYVDEPLRKVSTSYDYLDFKNSKLIRTIAEIESYNGETITTDYISSTGGLDTGATVDYVITPTEENISLPDITPIANTCIFETDTDVLGTLDITYIKDTNKVINSLESRIALLE